MTVETNISKRWEEGLPHHKKSILLFNSIEKLDLKFGNDYFCWKSGGDGDNGEHLMYLLDIHFELLEEGEKSPEIVLQQAWESYNKNKMTADEFACLVATVMQLELVH